MSEREAVEKIKKPNTIKSLVKDLKKLGLKEGDIVIAHASLSSLGWVVGREVAVIDALREVLGENGTLIMPSQTGDNSEPSCWQNPPVPENWWQEIRDNMPAFDLKRSPTRAMGKVVDALLKCPGCIRSNHPQVSFCGIGKHALEILEEHDLTPGLGHGSPLQKLYDFNAHILLLGVGYGNCTSLHLAESQLDDVRYSMNGAKILVDGKPTWITFEEIEYNDEDFETIGNDYEKEHQVHTGYVGAGLSRYIDMRELCDFGLVWMKENRSHHHEF